MKKSVVSLVLVAAASQVGAAQAPSIDRLVDCAAVSSAQERLACFDREVAPFASVRSQAGAPTAKATPAPVVKPAAPSASTAAPSPSSTKAASGTSASSFGEESLAKSKKEPAQPAEALHAKVQKLRPAGTGIFLMYLDNEQVWRHDDGEDASFLHEGDAITITRGALGTYRLTRDGGSAKTWIRVTRAR